MNMFCKDPHELLQEILELPGDKILQFRYQNSKKVTKTLVFSSNYRTGTVYNPKKIDRLVEYVKSHHFDCFLRVEQILPVTIKNEKGSNPLVNIYLFIFVWGKWYALTPDEILKVHRQLKNNFPFPTENYTFSEIPRNKSKKQRS